MRTEEFNHIILPMRSNLKAYALRLTESDDNAEDLVQEESRELTPAEARANWWHYHWYYVALIAAAVAAFAAALAARRRRR